MFWLCLCLGIGIRVRLIPMRGRCKTASSGEQPIIAGIIHTQPQPKPQSQGEKAVCSTKQ